MDKVSPHAPEEVKSSNRKGFEAFLVLEIVSKCKVHAFDGSDC
jgi:hypothetical protein